MRRPARRHVYPLLLLILAALGVVPLSHPALSGRLALRLLQFWHPDGACDAPRMNRWAALHYGLTIGCPETLLEGPRSQWMLRRIAHDRRAPMQGRVAAIGALARGGDPQAEKMLEMLVFSSGLSPSERREMWAYAAEGDDLSWSELAEAGGLHGLWARGKARLFAAGDDALSVLPALERPDPWVRRWTTAGLGVTGAILEEDCKRGAAGQMALDVPSSWQSVFLGPTCAAGQEPLLKALVEVEGHRRGEEHPLPDPLVLGEEEVDLLFYRNGTAGNLLREEIGATGRWIVAGSIGQRLRAALAHPRAENTAPAGDSLATLWAGSGGPGTTAMLAAMLGAQTQVDLEMVVGDGSVVLGVKMQGKSRFRVGTECFDGDDSGWTSDDREMDPISALNLGLLDAMGASLRAGDWEAAIAQGRATQEVPTWKELFRLGHLLAETLAPVEVQLPTEVRVTVPERLELLPSPPSNSRRRRRPPPPRFEPHPWSALRQQVAFRAEALRPLASSPSQLSLAAYWSAALPDPAHQALASELLPPYPDPVWAAAARALGDPVGTLPPSTDPCVRPFWQRTLEP